MSQLIQNKKCLEKLDKSFQQQDLNQFSASLAVLKELYSSRSSVYLAEYDLKHLLLSLGLEEVKTLISSEANNVVRLRNLGLAKLVSEDFDGALLEFSKVLEIDGNDSLALYWAGKACVSKGLYQEALDLLLASKNRVPETYLQVAKILMGQSKPDDALKFFEQAALLENTDVSWLTYIFAMKEELANGNLFKPELEANYRKVLTEFSQLAPDYKAEIAALQGDACLWDGDFKASLTHYVDALELNPNIPTVKPSLGYSLLALEQFEDAFPLVAHRHELKSDTVFQKAIYSQIPEWFGESLESKSILVYAEQGIGDQIFQLRYIKNLIAAFPGVRVSVLCDSRLVPLFKRSFSDQISYYSDMTVFSSSLHFDFFVRTTELQAYLEDFNDLSSCSLSSYLCADKEKTDYLKRKYSNDFNEKLKIGLCWKSLSSDSGLRKTLSLQDLKPLFMLDNIQWVSLQLNENPEDISFLEQEYGIKLYVDPEVEAKLSVDDLAAQVASLDAVVSVSSSVVHLAGAIGVPTYCFVPMKSFWYWHTSNGQSRWYNKVYLFRQTQRTDWIQPSKDLFETLKADLDIQAIQPISLEHLTKLNDTQAYQEIRRYFKKGCIGSSRQEKLLVATSYVEAGWLDDAVELLKPLLQENMDDIEASILFSDVALKKGLKEQAIAIVTDVAGGEKHLGLLLQILKCRIELEASANELSQIWKQAIGLVSNKVDDINKVSTFIGMQRDALTSATTVNVSRLKFLYEAAESFDKRFGKVNPIVRPAIMAELHNFEGDPQTAISLFQEAIQKKPELKKSYNSNISFCLLTQGNYKKGFQLNKNRLHDDRLLSNDTCSYPNIPSLTKINNPEDKALLIISEQGVGDQILSWQFLLNFSEIFHFRRIVFLVPHRLVEIAARTFGDRFEVYSEIYSLPADLQADINFQTYLGDIPNYIFGNDFPFKVQPKFLKPDEGLVAMYRKKYTTAFPNKKLVGLSWRSNSATWGGRKDINLNSFKDILEAEGCQCISVQYGASQAEIDQVLPSDLSKRMYLDDSFDSLKSFEHSIAQIAALDHVVTVSNVNAHFAGAMGIPASLLLKKLALWHWGNKVTSDWYPSLTIYREEDYDIWEPIFQKVLTDLS